MQHTAIFDQIGVFERYLGQIAVLTHKASPQQLEARLSDDGFSALEHFAIAQGYVLRALWPVMGRELPHLEDVTDGASLTECGAAVLSLLSGLSEADFAGQESREIRHVAGEAQLTQSASEFFHEYAGPNFFFHMSQGYAILRSKGAEIGKGDFDGFHSYPKGFSFVTSAAETV